MTQTPTPPDPKQPETSPERRFVQQRIVSPLIQWMPLGGGGWLFLGFLLKQEWLQVLLTFPVVVVTAVWAAYSKNFIERLSELYAAKGKQDADALNNWLASLDEALKWQFSGFDGKFLQQQAKLCQDYTTEGFNPDKTAIPMLEEVFVPLQLSGYGAESQTGLRPEDFSPDGLSIWDLLRRARKNPSFRQLAIQAQGGFGKTTLLRHVALIYGQGKYRRHNAPKLIPFLLHLRDWRDQLAQDPLPSLPSLITEHYLPSLSQSQPLIPPPRWVDNLLRDGKALVMLDGFDELADGQRQRLSHWISRQMQDYRQATFILTSRPAGFKDYVAKRPTTPLFVQKFNPVQQQDFIQRWYLCQERYARSEKQVRQAREVAERNAQKLLAQLNDPDRPELRQMAENPLLLNMLATYHRFEPGTDLPKRRVELYRGICKLQLEDRPRARGIPMLLPLEKSLRMLQNLGLAMVIHNRPTIAHAQLLKFWQNNRTLADEEVSPEAFLQQMMEVGELLVERERESYEFPHLSFQGYFAATCLANQGNAALARVRDNWHNAWWRETILLYTAQLTPRLITHVIGEACKLGKDAAQLAYDCLREYRNPERLHPALERDLKQLTATVQDLRFQQLEDYLKNGQWEAADQETYRLMITTVGKDVGQWFEREELLNFDCEVLLAIDGLWVKYSNGHFGFSVQKEIYVKSGAKLDGEYTGDKTWHRFCNSVGWRVNNSYISYNEVTFNTSSPRRGHLPVFPVVMFLGFFGAYMCLFSRIETCKV